MKPALLVFLLLPTITAHAADTVVKATVTDTDGQRWINGTWQARLFVPRHFFFFKVTPTVQGVPVPAYKEGKMDSSGTITASLTDLATLDQRDGRWEIQVCPNSSARREPRTGCVTIETRATGATVDLTAQLTNIKPPRFPAGRHAYGYRDVEVLTPSAPGATYYNTSDVAGLMGLRVWDGVRWNPVGGPREGETPPGFANSVTNAGSIAEAYTGPYQSAVVESNYAGTNEGIGYNPSNRIGQSQVTQSSSLFDYRSGQFTAFSRTPSNNIASSHYAYSLSMITDSTPADWQPGQVPLTDINLNLTTVGAGPSTYSYASQTLHHALNLQCLFLSQGLDECLTGSYQKYGIGDAEFEYTYMTYAAGVKNGDDEAVSGRSFKLNEITTVPVSTITSVSTSTDELGLAPVVANGQMGQGRILIQTKHADGSDAATVNGTLTGLTGSTMTGTWTVTPSTAVCSVIDPNTGSAAGIPTPNNLGEAQSMTITIANCTTSTAPVTTSYKACLKSLDREEQVTVSSASSLSSGRQTLTVLVRNTFHQAATLYQDSTGLCGSYGKVEGSKRSDGTNGLGAFYVYVPILGATDSKTLIYGTPIGNTEVGYKAAYILPVISNSGFVRYGNTVYFSGDPYLATHNVAITGTSSFNGTFPVSLAYGSSYGNLKFTLEGADIPSPEQGTATFDPGRSHFSAYAGAELLLTAPPDSTNNAYFESYAKVGTSSTRWEVGATVENPAWYYVPSRDTRETHDCRSFNCYGHEKTWSGPGFGSSSYAYNLHNQNRLSQYAGWGGDLPLGMSLFDVNGPWRYTFNFMPAPDESAGVPIGVTPNSTFVSFGCTQKLDGTTPDCSEGATYSIFDFGTKTGNGISRGYNSLWVDEANDALTLSLSGGATYRWGSNTWGLGEMTAGNSALSWSDAAKSLVVGNGNSLVINQGKLNLGQNLHDTSDSTLEVSAIGCCFPDTYAHSGIHFNVNSGSGTWMQNFNTQIANLSTIMLGNWNGSGFYTPIVVDNTEFHTGKLVGDTGIFGALHSAYPLPVIPPDQIGTTVSFTGTLGTDTAYRSYGLQYIMPDGTPGGISNDQASLSIPSAGLSTSNYVTFKCPVVPSYVPTGTTYRIWRIGTSVDNNVIVGTCAGGGTVIDNGSSTYGQQLQWGYNAPIYAGHVIVSPSGGDLQLMQEDANKHQTVSSYVWASAANEVSVGSARGKADATLDVGALKLSAATGTTQCLQVNTSGLVSGTGAPCGSGSGSSGVTQIVAGPNITVSPAAGTGVVTISATGGATGGTVTHTTGDLEQNKLVVGNGGGDTKVDPNISSDGAGHLAAKVFVATDTNPTNYTNAAILDVYQGAGRVFAYGRDANTGGDFSILSVSNNSSIIQSYFDCYHGGAYQCTFHGAPKLASLTGSTQCLQVDASGQIAGTGAPCGSSVGGSVRKVSVVNANGFAFSITDPTTTPTITLNVDNAHYLPTIQDHANWDAKAPSHSPVFTGTVTLPIAGKTQCLQVDAAGVVSGVSCGISNVQVALPTHRIRPKSCTQVSTVSMPGVTSISSFTHTFATDSSDVRGWGLRGGLTFIAWPTSDTLNWKVCNTTLAAITPGPLTMNVGAQ